ncbi:hypothetical protein D9619_005814 [Psilocybe cf. subviscida]|uniref:Uncharacterized protein n=1 Tax=Psilocybe cf. subviscida TaxID=2480587 RepID=A0A8H5BXI0_9AGAR|nr:hypothetical protein D9619_005814 [Psilocybe cf. subviscida]
MFTVTKALTVAFLAVSMASARPPQQTFLATCEYALTPDVVVDPNSIDTVTEFNSVIGAALGLRLPSGSVTDINNSTVVDVNNNTFNVLESVGVEGKTAKQTAAILTGLVGTTRSGFARGGTINWTFNSVSCDV